jgi:AraC-like DNA-binding protein
VSGPALATTFRHFCATGAGLEVRALRRPELILRTTRYERIIVDETILTPVFPLAVPVRSHAFVVLAGRFVAGALEAAPGDVVFQVSTDSKHGRWEATHFLDLEWDAPMTGKPALVGKCDLARARGLADRMLSAPQLDVLRDAFDFFRGAGLPLGDLAADRLEGMPSVLDQRLARAMEAQLENLSTRATTLHLEADSKISPRHLQRLIHQFNARYGINAGNWRDTRNRWRLQIAVALLSVKELTVQEIAVQVGYADAPALARGFANAGFPPPSEIRRQLGSS